MGLGKLIYNCTAVALLLWKVVALRNDDGLPYCGAYFGELGCHFEKLNSSYSGWGQL